MDTITITLPDNISFEEIALKWCSFNVWTERGIYFHQPKKKQNQSICFREYIEGISSVLTEDVAEFYPSDRIILIRDEEKFQPILDFIKHLEKFKPILDFIKERSNEQN